MIDLQSMTTEELIDIWHGSEAAINEAPPDIAEEIAEGMAEIEVVLNRRGYKSDNSGMWVYHGDWHLA